MVLPEFFHASYQYRVIGISRSDNKRIAHAKGIPQRRLIAGTRIGE